jgi:hypothetical protein
MHNKRERRDRKRLMWAGISAAFVTLFFTYGAEAQTHAAPGARSVER